MYQDVLWAIWRIGSTFLMSIPMVLLGFPIVALGLLFRREFPETAKPFTSFDTDKSWRLVRLPDWKWILPWDHTVDGFAGDTRGWWHHNQKDYGGSYNFLSMWHWGAFRNTCDYWRRFMISVPIDECRIEKLAGTHDEVDTNNHTLLVGNGVFAWNFLRATHKVTGKRWYVLCFVKPWTKAKHDEIGYVIEKGRCLNIWLGWKFKMQHASADFTGDQAYKRWKGFEFLIHPWKYYD